MARGSNATKAEGRGLAPPAERPHPTLVGVAVTSISLAVMWWLARAKRRTAVALG